MGLYDRKYMKDSAAGRITAGPSSRKPVSSDGLTRWQRFRFNFWLVLHGRRGGHHGHHGKDVR